MGSGSSRLAFPMVSFCDIPITRIKEHTSYYGDYGLGMSKDWGRSSGLNPLLYINGKSAFADELVRAIDVVVQTEKKNESVRFRQALHLLKYTKPMTGTTHKSGTAELKDFYQESEWRFIPSVVIDTDSSYLVEDDFKREDERCRVDEAALKEGPLTFALTDIRYLFVKTVSEIPFLIDFVNSNLGHYPANQLKILTSRIISLEDVWQDL